MVSFDKRQEVGITATPLGQLTDCFLLARHFECVSLGISDSQYLYTQCISGTYCILKNLDQSFVGGFQPQLAITLAIAQTIAPQSRAELALNITAFANRRVTATAHH